MMKKLFILLSIFLIHVDLFSQSKTINGVITTFEEIPVQNAVVVVKSSGQKVNSDSLGTFSVQCKSNDQIKISAAGFGKRNIKIKEETKLVMINMTLLPKESAKELAVGYGHVKDKNKLYAMAEQRNGINYSQYNNIYEILTGNFTGVQIINGEVIVRASASFSSSATALLIVDGREVNNAFFSALHPADIAQINVLKDASASVYGSQGANGVVIVTTKRGWDK